MENKDNEIVNGAFSNSKRYITQKDVKKIKESVIEAKNNDSVMFQDVISFDNDFWKEKVTTIQKQINLMRTYCMKQLKV